VERKFRETRQYQVAPIGNNLVTSFYRDEGPRTAPLVLKPRE
jgi:hypothetical protein